MKLNKFIFEDKAREWRLEETNFNRLTLLVGASGVGKTQILKAIHSLKEIALGESINGVKWFVDFNIGSENHYTWEGEFEKLDINPFVGDEDEEESVKNKPKLLSEKILFNKNVIAERNADKILFQGKETIKLSREKSLVNHLKEENEMSSIISEMKRIHMTDHSSSRQEAFRINFFDANKLAKKYNTLKKIQDSDIDIRGKLFLVYKNDKKTFSQIKERFIDIFPQVEDVKVAPIDLDKEEMPSIFKDYPFIQIKERGVNKWVQQSRISSGMFRSLIHIGELYLSPEGTVFLIDEFENSLGINCIDELTADILQSKRQLQFILTSHHPYIINSINFNNWKLVTRNASVVKTHDLTKFNLGKSKHEAFMQLLQLEEYQTGSEQV